MQCLCGFKTAASYAGATRMLKHQITCEAWLQKAEMDWAVISGRGQKERYNRA